MNLAEEAERPHHDGERGGLAQARERHRVSAARRTFAAMGDDAPSRRVRVSWRSAAMQTVVSRISPLAHHGFRSH